MPKLKDTPFKFDMASLVFEYLVHPEAYPQCKGKIRVTSLGLEIDEGAVLLMETLYRNKARAAFERIGAPQFLIDATFPEYKQTN